MQKNKALTAKSPPAGQKVPQGFTKVYLRPIFGKSLSIVAANVHPPADLGFR